MLTMLVLAAALPVTASQAPATPVTRCAPKITMTRDDQAVRVRPLGDMPPATGVLAVYRQFGRGCADLAVVRHGVGTPGR